MPPQSSPPVSHSAKTWYREPWPWILFGLPALAVVAGLITLWYAIVSNDGLVEDDYYKQGLGINRTLARDELASALDIGATFSLGGKTVTLSLHAKEGVHRPQRLWLSFIHPGKAGFDQRVDMQLHDTAYTGVLAQDLSAGPWRILLEDEDHAWRVLGEARFPVYNTLIELRSRPLQPAPN